MPETPKIDAVVEEKIDLKIEEAQLKPDPTRPTSTAVDTTEQLASRTTAEQDRNTAGQRQINNVWEYTQSFVAMTVVLTTSVGIFIGRVMQGNATPFPAEWWTIVGLVIGFYFGRTNHSRMGDNAQIAREFKGKGEW